MKISELKANQGNVEVEGIVRDKQEPREFVKFGKSGKVCNAKLKDDSGEISLTLWNDQVDLVKEGTKLKITNGWVGEYKDEKQLSTGKFGQLEILGSSTETETETQDEPEEVGEEEEIGD